MSLQEAIDIIHEIREEFPHVAPYLTPLRDRTFRDGSRVYIIGVYQGSASNYKRSWIISNGREWQEFMLLYKIFSNA